MRSLVFLIVVAFGFGAVSALYADPKCSQNQPQLSDGRQMQKCPEGGGGKNGKCPTFVVILDAYAECGKGALTCVNNSNNPVNATVFPVNCDPQNQEFGCTADLTMGVVVTFNIGDECN